ncbi:MAG: 2,3-bisphosphoglycerate-independent phosphoglycerate mutase [Clostridiales Family XIII bacterium]|jgi:2,3-bisphosphoglycerate-independent phosphoglycerate mutase|nr:2,3-bisphosphoglycerate-independent phosphoglycerate mutase [Clostridiales Family XIII bacterium]
MNMKINRRPTMLMILDGWGYREEEYGNAVKQANTPVLDKLFAEHPHTLIHSSGLAVGLPDGQMGNSEVGHLNIGAGRTVYQSLTRITKSIADGDFFENSVLTAAMENAERPGRSLHLMGLVSDGGVHSHTDHLLALVRMAKDSGVPRIYIHAFLDGRDTPPRSAAGFLSELESNLLRLEAGEVVTISGRYYAMDRDNRWERVELAYDALTLGSGEQAATAADAIRRAYEDRDENDEFVKPTNIYPAGGEAVTVRDGDSVIFFNFRPDRAREITRAFTEPDFRYELRARNGGPGPGNAEKAENANKADKAPDKAPDTYVAGFDRKKMPDGLYFATMTSYDATLSHVRIAFPPDEISNTLGEYLSSRGLTQLRIAETEKYAHVTFFFNGGVETPNAGEDRVLIASPKVATYDLKPEMSAYEVADRAVSEIRSGRYDVIILNFANMDMVGHTGILGAAILAAEAVDACVGKIVRALAEAGGQLLITADHGNSEEELTPDGKPVTSHTTNDVPLILVRTGDAEFTLADGGALSDLAPTLLDMMEIAAPPEMTGHSLLMRKS